MEAFITSLALLLLFAGLVAAVPMAFAGWRRLVAREGDLQIWRVMRRRGLEPDDTAVRDATLARAVRRCVMCPSIDDCNHWLASGKREGLGLFCPNATFFRDIERQKESRDTP
jgi:hypothetical protein